MGKSTGASRMKRAARMVRAVVTVLVIGASIAVPIVPVTATAAGAASDAADVAYYSSELAARFGPLTATDDELGILLDGPTGNYLRSLVDGARLGDRIFSSDDEAKLASAQLQAGLLKWVGDAVFSAGLDELKLGLTTAFGDKGLVGAAAIEAFSVRGVLEQASESNELVSWYANLVLGARHRTLLELYASERLAGSDDATAWDDTVGHFAELEPDYVSKIAANFGVTLDEYPALVERHYQLGRLSFDPAMVDAQRSMIDGATSLLRTYRSDKKGFVHLLGGTRGFTAVNAGRLPIRVTYVDGDNVVGFAALDPGQATALGLDVDFTDVTDVLLEAEGIGRWKAPVSAYSVDRFSDPISVTGDGVDRTFTVERVFRSHNGMPPANTISWTFGGGATPATSSPGDLVAKTFDCPGTYPVAAKISSDPLPVIDLSTSVTIPDPWHTAIARAPQSGFVLPGNSITLTATGDIPADVSYAWNFGNGETATGPVVMKSWTTTGRRDVSLTLTQPGSSCSRTVRTVVFVGVVTDYLPTRISSEVKLQPQVVYLTGYQGTSIDARGSLIVPAGAVVKMDGGISVDGGRVDLQGTAANPVVLTSASDSTIGGSSTCSGCTGWGLSVGSGGTVSGTYGEFRNARLRGSGGSYDLTDTTLRNSDVDVTATAGTVGWSSRRLRFVDLSGQLVLRGSAHRLTDTYSNGTSTIIWAQSASTFIDGLDTPSSTKPLAFSATATTGGTVRRVTAAPGATIGIDVGSFKKATTTLASRDLPYRLSETSYGAHVIPAGGRVQVLPGVRLVMANPLSVEGSLVLSGTSDLPVRITKADNRVGDITLGSSTARGELQGANATIATGRIAATAPATVALTDSMLNATTFSMTNAAGELVLDGVQAQASPITVRGAPARLHDVVLSATTTGLDLGSGARATVDGLVVTQVPRPVVMDPSSSDSTFDRLDGDSAAHLYVSAGTYPARTLEWRATDWPYELGTSLYGDHTLPAGATVRVSSGATVLNNQTLNLTGGTFELAGNETAPAKLRAASSTAAPRITATSGALVARHSIVAGHRVDLSGSAVATIEDTVLDTVPFFYNNCGATTGGTTLDRVDVQRGAITLASGSHSLTDVTITDVPSAVLSLSGNAIAAVDGLTVTSGYISVTPAASRSTFQRLTGPPSAAIRVSPGTYPSGTTMWSATDWPYLLTGSSSTVHQVPAGATLRVAPDIRVLADALLSVSGGALDLAGTRDHRVTLGAASAGWPGVSVSTPGSIRGQLTTSQADISGRVVVTNADASLLRSRVSALESRSGARVTSRYGAVVTSAIADASATLDAIHNWWGAATGPRIGSTTSTAATIAGPVAFDPWCHLPDCSDVDPEADRDPPDVIAVPDREPNDADWYGAAVTIDWRATDGGTELPAPPPVTVDVEGASQLVTSAPVCDAVGNCASGAFVVSLDLSAPTIAPTLETPPNANGWHNSPVLVAWYCSDDVSGIASCSDAQDLTSDGVYALEGSAVDASGHASSATTTVRVDTLAPEITVTGPGDGASVRYADFIPPSCTATDSGSGIAAPCAVSVTSAATTPGATIYDARAVATDVAGNVAEDTWSFTVTTDTDGPMITAVADRDPNINGWYNAPVSVRFTCSDTSGVAACPEPVDFDAAGPNQSAEVTATDIFGNANSFTVVGINIDLAAPIVELTNAKATYTVDEQVSIGCRTSDTESGVWTAHCPAIDQRAVDLGVGTHTLTAAATDRAGNVTEQTITFEVVATPASVSAIVDNFAGAGSGPAKAMRNAIASAQWDSFGAQINAFCCTEDRQGRTTTAKPLSRSEAAVLGELLDALRAP